MKWSDINIDRFRKIQSIITDNDIDDLTKKVFLYSLLSGQTIEEVRDIPLGIFLKAYSDSLEFINEAIPQIIPIAWEHKGVSYKITTAINELTAGQYIDLKEYAKEPDNIHKVMAVLCYDGKKYDGATHKERAELFNEQMPITIAAPLTAFFLELWREWSEISLAYSVKVLKESEAEWNTMVGSTG